MEAGAQLDVLDRPRGGLRLRAPQRRHLRGERLAVAPELALEAAVVDRRIAERVHGRDK